MRASSKLKRMLLSAIASASVAAGSTSAAAPARTEIPIAGVAFAKTEVSVSVGDTVEWVNNDIVDHTSTDRKNGWNVSIAPGKRESVVMKTAGTFEYFCRYHPNMVGRVVVSAPKKK